MLPFLDLFQRENVRVDLFKSILQAFVNKLVTIKLNFHFNKFINLEIHSKKRMILS